MIQGHAHPLRFINIRAWFVFQNAGYVAVAIASFPESPLPNHGIHANLVPGGRYGAKCIYTCQLMVDRIT